MQAIVRFKKTPLKNAQTILKIFKKSKTPHNLKNISKKKKEETSGHEAKKSTYNYQNNRKISCHQEEPKISILPQLPLKQI